MPKNKRWLPFCVADYMMDTEILSQAEHGAYILLLFHYWNTQQPLPLDLKRLYQITKSTTKNEQNNTRFIIEKYFKKEAVGFTNFRMDKVILAQEAYAQKQRDNANKRWEQNKQMRMPPHFSSICQNTYQTDARSDAYSKDKTNPVGLVVSKIKHTHDHFDKFWGVYPRKIGKIDARKKWMALNCDSIADQIIESVLAHMKTEAWKKNNGEFIPHPATYLSQGRWEDELGVMGSDPKVNEAVLVARLREYPFFINRVDGCLYPASEIDRILRTVPFTIYDLEGRQTGGLPNASQFNQS